MPVDSRPPYRPGAAGRWFLALLAYLPMPVVALLGELFGWLAILLDYRRRRTAAVNLHICFPDLAPRAAHRLMRRHFRAFTRTVFCALALGEHGDAGRVRECVTVRGREHYDRLLAAGKPVILLAPHFIALELGWLRLSLERSMLAMYREPRRHLFHWAVHKNRTRFGGELTEREASLRPVVRRIEAGTPFYYLPDIDPGESGHFAFVPFFGTPAATVTAVSRLAQLTGAAVVPCITRLKGLCRFETELFAPLENFPGDDPELDAARLNAWIEAQVRETPEQYFWVHRRFKTRPGGAASPYSVK